MSMVFTAVARVKNWNAVQRLNREILVGRAMEEVVHRGRNRLLSLYSTRSFALKSPTRCGAASKRKAIMGNDQNKQVVRRFIEEGLNSGNLDRVADVFDPAYANYIFGQPTDLAGAKQALAQFQAAFPDMHETIEDIVAEGDTVSVRETFSATHRGNFNGIPATGKRVTVQAQTFFRMRQGKIAEDRPLLDMFGLLQQLGAIPAPNSGTENV